MVPPPGRRVASALSAASLALACERCGADLVVRCSAVGDTTAVTAVLVHGSWHGSWCWERVVPLLERSGLRVATIDLPSCGRDTASLADLAGDAEAVRLLLDGLDGPLVICAHSYGGAPVTAAAAGLGRVHRLVYLSAFMPDVGESCSAITGGSLPPWCVVRGDGSFSIDPDVAGEVLYGDCDPQTRAAAISRLVPQRLVTSTQAVPAAAWRTIPSTYVVCTRDRAIPQGVQLHMGERAGEMADLDSSHSAFLSMPGAVAALIVSRAG